MWARTAPNKDVADPSGGSQPRVRTAAWRWSPWPTATQGQARVEGIPDRRVQRMPACSGPLGREGVGAAPGAVLLADDKCVGGAVAAGGVVPAGAAVARRSAGQ